MKKILLVISTVIVAVGVTVFGFSSFYENSDTSSKQLKKISNTDLVSNGKAPSFAYLTNTDFSENQDLEFAVWGRYNRPLTKEKLVAATSIGDVIPNYPTNWISEYETVELIILSDGIEKRASGSDEHLTSEQLDIIQSADIGNDVIIDVRYTTKNTATNTYENQVMNVKFTLVPEVEAGYVGGYDQMISYLTNNSRDKIEKMKLDLIEPASVFFTVNEQGETENIQLNRTLGDAEIDRLLIKLVKQMPKWKPAEDAQGLAIKQDFELIFGKPGC